MKACLRILFLCCALVAAPAFADPVQPGEILVSTACCSVNGFGDFREAMYRVDPSTGAQTLLSKDDLFGGISDILITPDRRILCTSQGAPGGGPGRVLAVDPSSGAQAVFASGGFLLNPGSIGLGTNGTLLLTDYGQQTGDGKIIRLDPTTAAQTLVVGGLKEPTDALELSSGDILISDYDDADPGMFLWHHASGQITKVTHEPLYVTSILLASDGSIYIAEVAQFDRLDLLSGNVTGLSPIYALFKMAQESSGDTVLAGGESSNVYRVDPTSGATTVVSHLGNLFYPLAIAVWPDAPVRAQSLTWGKLKAQYR